MKCVCTHRRILIVLARHFFSNCSWSNYCHAEKPKRHANVPMWICTRQTSTGTRQMYIYVYASERTEDSQNCKQITTIVNSNWYPEELPLCHRRYALRLAIVGHRHLRHTAELFNHSIAARDFYRSIILFNRGACPNTTIICRHDSLFIHSEIRSVKLTRIRFHSGNEIVNTQRSYYNAFVGARWWWMDTSTSTTMESIFSNKPFR